jgi:pimeloyl-ACP methyl ester carboxylesterase
VQRRHRPTVSVASARAVCGLLVLVLASCVMYGPSKAVIPTELVPAIRAGKDRVLLIVVPGIFNDDKNLEEHGLHDAIHKSWPTADILLTSANLPYYRDGVFVERMDDIIRKARADGYRQIWLLGGSLGGMGALMYERDHPGEVTGLLLLAPYLGDDGLLQEIERAGGVESWEPGPLPDAMSRDDYARQVWRMIKGWTRRPDLAQRVWLTCGSRDHMRMGVELMAPQIPPTHYVPRPGEHNWDFWLAATEDMVRRVHASTLARREVSAL